LGAIVCNDHVHDPIPVYDLLDELDCHLQGSYGYRFILYLLGKLVDHEKQVIKALKGRWEFPD
jgi:hypothetical protein